MAISGQRADTWQHLRAALRATSENPVGPGQHRKALRTAAAVEPCPSFRSAIRLCGTHCPGPESSPKGLQGRSFAAVTFHTRRTVAGDPSASGSLGRAEGNIRRFPWAGYYLVCGLNFFTTVCVPSHQGSGYAEAFTISSYTSAGYTYALSSLLVEAQD